MLKSYMTKDGKKVKTLGPEQTYEMIEKTMYESKEHFRIFVEFAYSNYPDFIKFCEEKIMPYSDKKF